VTRYEPVVPDDRFTRVAVEADTMQVPATKFEVEVADDEED
jgi:hypothetical protein